MASQTISITSASQDSLHATKRRVQIGSALLFLITAVALSAIFALHPSVGIILFPVSTLGAIASVTLIAFAISSCLIWCARRKITQETMEIDVVIPETPPEDNDLPHKDLVDASDRQLLQLENPSETTLLPENSTPPSPVSEVNLSAKDFFQNITANILPPLLTSVNRLITAIIQADAQVCKTKGNNDLQASAIMSDVQEFTALQVNKFELHVAELLRNFGRGKVSLLTAQIRCIAAYNSGNPEAYKTALEEYRLIQSGNNLSDIQAALKQEHAKKGAANFEQIYTQFPNLLSDHFCSSNLALKDLGLEILRSIFAKKPSQSILDLLKALAREKKEQFTEKTEQFVMEVFKAAQFEDGQLSTWMDRLMRCALSAQLQTLLRQTVRLTALNLRSLGRILSDEDKKTLYPYLNEVMLISTCHNHLLQPRDTELISLQCRINVDLDEKKRISLLVFKTQQKRDTTRSFLKLPTLDLKDYGKEIAAFEQKHKVYLSAVLIPHKEHPMKSFKKFEGAIRVGGGVANFFGKLDSALESLKNWLNDNLLPQLTASLPNFTQEELETVKRLFDALLTPLLRPIYNGVVSNTPLKTHFRTIISGQGNALASTLEQLANNPEISFETLRDTACVALNAFAAQFETIKDGKSN